MSSGQSGYRQILQLSRKKKTGFSPSSTISVSLSVAVFPSSPLVCRPDPKKEKRRKRESICLITAGTPNIPNWLNSYSSFFFFLPLCYAAEPAHVLLPLLLLRALLGRQTCKLLQHAWSNLLKSLEKGLGGIGQDRRKIRKKTTTQSCWITRGYAGQSFVWVVLQLGTRVFVRTHSNGLGSKLA